MYQDFQTGDLVWFDPGVGYVLPGEVLEFHNEAQVIIVQAVINAVTKTFTLNNLSSVRPRQDLGQNGMDDMIAMKDLNEASLLWNLRLRYDNRNIYTYIGTILVSVNPYRTFDDREDLYGLEAVSKYDGQILGTLPPHLFAVGSAALSRQIAHPNKNVVIILSGESGSGKTESAKLLLQYLSAVNKSSSNLITEQILETSHLLESFGHAKTIRNDNSSRFGKFIEVVFKDGVIGGAKFTDYLLEKSRIVSHSSAERNYHIFYEMLAGLNRNQKEKLGLMSTDKYFYLNQGGSPTIDGKVDKEDFESLVSSFQVLGFTSEERDTVFKILATILHLGNVYFNLKHFKHGAEGVEVGSDVEIKWAAHLLQLNVNEITKALTTKLAPESSPRDPLYIPMNIDQALDARDAISKALYGSLFSWIIKRVNKIIGGKMRGSKNQVNQHHQRTSHPKGINILDMFGFEDFNDNSFEQLCINYANESLQHYFNKHVFKMEQAEYAKEKIEWTPIQYTDNMPIINILSKKPIGIFFLLDDESNFPKATDGSFLEKCHYNHALNDLYSRPRMSSMEFGVKHYAGQVWYNVNGFLEKNRDTLRYDIMSLLIGSKEKMISKMFLDLRSLNESTRTINNNNHINQSNGHLVTMKPRAATVAARFIENLHGLLGFLNTCTPFYILCIKPNNDKCPQKFDMPVVLEQLRYAGMLETIRIRKTGYPIRMKYRHFAEKYRCLLGKSYPTGGYRGGGAPTTKELTRIILERIRKSDVGSHRHEQITGSSYEFGATKVFLKETLSKRLEKDRREIHDETVVKLQRAVRGYLARKRYLRMKNSAVKIQSSYRGYVERKNYAKARKGVVALQAVYRMNKQRSIYGELKKQIRQREEEEERARKYSEQAAAKSQISKILEEKARRHTEISSSSTLMQTERRTSRKEIINQKKRRRTHSRDDEMEIEEEILLNEEIASSRARSRSRYEDEFDDDLEEEELIITEKRSRNDFAKPLSSPRVINPPPKLSRASPSSPPAPRFASPPAPRFASPPAPRFASPPSRQFLVETRGVNHLEIPAELAFIMSKIEDWNPANAPEKNVGKITEPLKSTPLKGELKLPSDIDYYSFSKVANIYFKHHLWQMKTEPIKTPFLSKSKESDYQESLAIFKLILRFMNDGSLKGKKEKVLSDYIVNKGLKNEKLRDEIYCQLANQTRKNDIEENNERGWFLMSNCLSAFPPSRTLYKYLLKYVSDHAYNGYRYVCQQKLLRAGANQDSRIYPPTALEWRANKRKLNMALDTRFSDSESRLVPIESLSTAEEFAASAIAARGIPELSGWTVTFERNASMNDEGQRYTELNGGDYVMDVIAETELPPAFPKGKDPFLQTSNGGGVSRGRSKASPSLMINTSDLLQGPPPSKKHQQRAHSEDRILAVDDFGLSSESALNHRYFESEEKSRQKNNRSKSLDNLLGGGGSDKPPSNNAIFGLSENSRLNQRYRELTVSPTDMMESVSQHGQRLVSTSTAITTTTATSSTKWDEIGLSKNNPLNDRYFSQPDLLADTKLSQSVKETRHLLTRSSGNLKVDQDGMDLTQFEYPTTNGGALLLKKGRPRFVKGRRRYEKSSAMSDTSEAPSIASHVRRVRVPSQASDVDQFLDDLFMPVLDDGNVDDGLSDAKSLAASMRGGGGKKKENSEAEDNEDEKELSVLTRLTDLVSTIRGSRDNGDPNPTSSSTLGQTSVGFQPIPGVVTPTMSPPPPMLIPTPVQGSFLNTPNGGYHNNPNPPPTLASDGSALAFTYVPVPVYNMGGIGIPGMMSPSVKPEEHHQASSTPNPTPAPNGGTAIASNVAYQQAFIQNAVAQNMQIQQQLMVQNQALSQLLSQAVTTGSPQPTSLSSVMSGLKLTESVAGNEAAGYHHSSSQHIKSGDMMRTTTQTSSKIIHSGGEEEEIGEEEIIRQSKTTPNTPKLSTASMEMELAGIMDPYMRARTVRIGKWRWPPPKEEMENGDGGIGQTEGFFEFKLRKMQEKKASTSSSHLGQGFISPSNQHFSSHQQHMEMEANQLDISEDMADWGSNNGSIGKLKISSEIKNKLEAAVTGSQKNSVRSINGQERLELSAVEIRGENFIENGVRKLTENRKLLLEQKLGKEGMGKLKKWNTVDEVHRTLEDIPDAPNRKSSHAEDISIPPPPPFPFMFSKTTTMKSSSSIPPPPPPPRNESLAAEELFNYALEEGGGLLTTVTSRTHRERESLSVEKIDKRYDLGGSSEFLTLSRVQSPRFHADGDAEIRRGGEDDDDYQSVDDIRTRLHPPNSTTSLAYTRAVPWNLRIRKELFSPSENIQSPLAVHLVFSQIVRDLFSPLCIRLTREERTRLKTLLDEYHINPDNIGSSKHKLSTKRNIIEVAKDCDTYFSRLYPVSSGLEGDVQYLSISHKGVRLVRREKSLPTDYFEALETYSFEDIGEVSTVKSHGLQLVTHTGGRLLTSTPKAEEIKDLLNQYLIEAKAGHYDYVKALAPFRSKDENALTFKKGDIIAVVPKRDAYTQKGWLYGIKDGQYGLFPSDFVDPLSPHAIRREMRIIAKVTQRSQQRKEPEEDAGTAIEEDDVMIMRNTRSERTLERRRIHTDDEDEDDDDIEDDEDEIFNEKSSVMSNRIGDHWDESNKKRISSDPVEREDGALSDVSETAKHVSNDGKHPLLEFALQHFQDSLAMKSQQQAEFDKNDTKKKKKQKNKKSSTASNASTTNDWTWKDQVDLVKWTPNMITNSLLRLETPEQNHMALECFAYIMRVMGDLPLLANHYEVECVRNILLCCYNSEIIRDEVYCQIMKQTTNNKSVTSPDSCQKGWRLFSIIASYFACSDVLRPYLFKYLETAAYDKRRAYHGTALVCLHNLRKTFKYGGRVTVPSIEEITAIAAGRSSKRQIYRLPGRTERIINTKSTTVVEDIIDELCRFIGVESQNEKEEFSLCCIIEREYFTKPLSRHHYILDLTTGLQHENEEFYLMFCRSVWRYPLRLDNPLYIEVVFNQIAPDYLEGHLLVMPGGQIEQDVVYDISKIAALLHKAADMTRKPSIKETKFLLPKLALSVQDIKPPQWVNMVQGSWNEISNLTSGEAKAEVLKILSTWSLFGSNFFAVSRLSDSKEENEHMLALNKHGVIFLDLYTHETILHYPFTEVISTRKVEIEDRTMYLDMKCGNLMQQRITRIKTMQADEIARLIRQYITIDQKLKGIDSHGNTKKKHMEQDLDKRTPSR